MRHSEPDPAQPDQIRRSTRAAEEVTVGLDDSRRWSRVALDQFGARPFMGNSAERIRASGESMVAFLVDAEYAHEQVADGLRRLADPVEDEQRARRRRREARQAKQEARDRLDEAKANLAAIESELTCAEGTLAAQQARVATAQAANVVRSALGQSPVPVDTVGLYAAQQEVARAKQQVQRASRRVDRASDLFELAGDRFDRMRRAHERAEHSREVATRGFIMRLQLAGVLPLLPFLPGAPLLPGHSSGQEGTSVNLAKWLRQIVSGVNKGTALAKAGPQLPPQFRRVLKAVSQGSGLAQRAIDLGDIYTRRRREGASHPESATGTASEGLAIAGCARTAAKAVLRTPVPPSAPKGIATAAAVTGAALGCSPAGRLVGDQTSNAFSQAGQVLERTIHDPVWPLRVAKKLPTLNLTPPKIPKPW